MASSIPKSTPIAKDITRISLGLRILPRVRGIIITIPIKIIIEQKKLTLGLKTEENPHMRLLMVRLKKDTIIARVMTALVPVEIIKNGQS